MMGISLGDVGSFVANTLTMGGYGAQQAGEAQASAARYAAERNAAAMEYSADRAAEASERSAQLQADAMIRAGQMQANMQRQMMEMQRDIFRRQMLQAERFAVRDELRYVAGKAATDTFNKVAGTATTLWEINDIAREQRLIEQFGLNDDTDLQAPPVAPNSWEASNYDLLTGARVSDSNPYALESDLMNDLEREEAAFDQLIDGGAMEARDQDVPGWAQDVWDEAGNHVEDGGGQLDQPANTRNGR